MYRITAFTDGSCNARTYKGGIGVYLVTEVNGERYTAKISKGFYPTKTGRMELMAVIYALESVSKEKRKTTEMHIISDSQYVVNGINRHLKFWLLDGLESRKNGDLWKRYLRVSSDYMAGAVKISWVRGHNGTYGNEMADSLAGLAYRSGEYEKEQDEAGLIPQDDPRTTSRKYLVDAISGNNLDDIDRMIDEAISQKG